MSCAVSSFRKYHQNKTKNEQTKTKQNKQTNKPSKKQTDEQTMMLKSPI